MFSLLTYVHAVYARLYTGLVFAVRGCHYLQCYVRWCRAVLCISLMYVRTYVHIYLCAVVDEWTMEDKVIFEQAYQKYGKNFQRIKSMVSNVCMAHLTSLSAEGLHAWAKHPVTFVMQ